MVENTHAWRNFRTTASRESWRFTEGKAARDKRACTRVLATCQEIQEAAERHGPSPEGEVLDEMGTVPSHLGGKQERGFSRRGGDAAGIHIQLTYTCDRAARTPGSRCTHPWVSTTCAPGAELHTPEVGLHTHLGPS